MSETELFAGLKSTRALPPPILSENRMPLADATRCEISEPGLALTANRAGLLSLGTGAGTERNAVTETTITAIAGTAPPKTGMRLQERLSAGEVAGAAASGSCAIPRQRSTSDFHAKTPERFCPGIL